MQNARNGVRANIGISLSLSLKIRSWFFFASSAVPTTQFGPPLYGISDIFPEVVISSDICSDPISSLRVISNRIAAVPVR